MAGTRRYRFRGMRAPVRSALQVNDAAPDADGHGLRAILRTELVHDVPDVDLDGLFGDREALADVPVAVAFGHPRKHFDLPLAQGIAAEVFGEVLRNLRRQVLAARVDLADRLDELLERRGLQEISTNAGRQRALNFNVAFEGGQDDDPASGKSVRIAVAAPIPLMSGSRKSMSVMSG